MAGIVPSLFGPTPEELMSLRRQEQAQTISSYAPAGGRAVIGAAVGTALARGINSLFGLEDPQIKRATDVYNVLTTTQQQLGAAATDPTQLYPALQENFAKAGYGDIAEKVSTEGATKILDWNTKQATLQQKAFDLKQDQEAKVALQDLNAKAAEEGRTPTSEEIISTLSTYLPVEKLAPLIQNSADKEKWRDVEVKRMELQHEDRLLLARERQADKKEIEAIRQENKKELEALKATLNPKSSSKSSVYERGYANQALTSFNELVPAFDNISIMTNRGVNPVTGSAFAGLKGTGFMSATGQQLGQVLTTADQAQYESIMKPAIYNVAVIQAGGRVPRQTQIDNLMTSLLAKGNTVPQIAQLQKLGELRQIVEKANEAYQINPAATDEQKALAQEAVDTYAKAIPFNGTDVAKFSVYSKKNPSVKFQDWLKVNGSTKDTPTKAPQVALDMLSKDPTLAPAFKAKYKYLPEGY
jgi:hypothetical protein